MPEFLADNNTCAQTILQLVSRGNAIIAEILRLKDYIPNIYRLDKQNVQKYGKIIFDFSYFKVAEWQEHAIENNDILLELDKEFRDNHLEIVSRFYSVFESVHSYVSDLNHYLDELDDGFYIHQTLETVFADIEGKQLLCEALYLYGTMLLMVDTHIEGIIRERILVSYYRYTPQRRDRQTCIDEVCKLLRDTGLASGKKPSNYPEDYFKRIPMKASFVDMVIGKLRSDDVYNQLSVYPLSKHRSTALCTQAAMLYICLFFSTPILHTQNSIMREIVDKYFPDNFTISIYMGFIINLVESWDSFKAAKMALNNTLEASNIKSHSTFYTNSVPELVQITSELLKEGTITKENLLQNINKTINVIRDCNVTIRWIMMHYSTRNENKRSRLLKYDTQLFNMQFKLLLNTSQLELIIRDTYKELLNEKGDTWEKLKRECHRNLSDLSEVFSGNKPLTRVEKNTNLQRWFLEISKQVESLEQDTPQKSSESSMKIVQLIQALEEVQEFHQLDSDMQVVQFLTETRRKLNQMIRTMKIKDDVLITLQIIGDISYCWELIDSFTVLMQSRIKKEPPLVIKFRAVFLKLSSALEIPLLRINQAHSEDLISVSQYYSHELEIYIRKVLQIIPKTMFEKMARIIEMQTSVLKELPTRLETDKLKEYAQLNERYEFAELTHSISIFSQGMRMMKSTLVGVVCLDPKKLLEDGIRKELVQHISKALHEGLIFSSKPKHDELEQRLKSLGCIMDGYKRSFEYIQDYVNLNGLKIWQEEVTRIINYNVERECNGFLRNKVHEWESVYQNRIVPIPTFPSLDNISENFIGRLARELLRITDPKVTLYLEQTSSWYDIKTQKVVANKQIISFISSAIEVTGLVGLDRLFSFMIITHLKKITEILENKDNKNQPWTNILSMITSDLKSNDFSQNSLKFYQNCINRASKLFPPVTEHILTIGHLQILRNLIAFQLNTMCKFDAKNLESSLTSLNKALLNDISKEDRPPEELMHKLSLYFDYAGLNNPMNKIYITVKFREEFAIHLFIFTICSLQKMFLYACPGTGKRSYDFDGAAFITGMHTLLKQFHTNLNKKYIENLCQYIVNITKLTLRSKNPELSPETISALKYLDIYSNYSKASNNYYKEFIPDEIQHLCNSIV